MQTARYTRAGVATSAKIARALSGLMSVHSGPSAARARVPRAPLLLSLLALVTLALIRPATEHADGVAGIERGGIPTRLGD